MSNENKTQTSKYYFLWKFLLLGSLGLFISWLALKIILWNAVDINPKLYARTFMVWRNKGGDASMFEGRYKGYKKNDYKADPKFTKFLEFAQGESGSYIIAGNYPFHAPRGPEKLFTLIDKNRIVEELWKVEFNIKALLNDKKTEDSKLKWRKSAYTALKNKTYEQEFKLKWFTEDKNISDEEIKKAFEVDEERWWKARSSFYNILYSLSKNDADYKFKDGSVSPKLFKQISKLFEYLGYNAEDYKNEINSFFKNMGTVKASPFETYAYSRLFNFYNFLTINHDFNYKKEIKKENEKKKDEYRAKEKAEIFAHIFANVYEEPFDFELKKLTFWETLSKYFGINQNIDNITKDQNENIKNSLETMANNLGD